MGFVLGILYFVIYYLTPSYLLGAIAEETRIQVVIAVLIILISILPLLRSFTVKTPQALALFGLGLAVMLSLFFGMHWISGGIAAFLSFIPNALAYFIICLHCTTKRRIQVVVMMMMFVCLFVAVHGYMDLRNGVADGPPPGVGIDEAIRSGATASPYLTRQMNQTGEWIYRLQGLGEVNDANDYGQLLVTVIPLSFIFWRPGKTITNFLFVIVPVAGMLFAMFLTHSRGSLLALTAVALVASRRRIGTVPAAILAGVLFIAANALHFTGGRDISASAGEDRTALWGQGMAAVKSHPLWGVGYSHLYEYTDNHLTAHNSIIVCASELGLFGFYFWSLFLFPTFMDALRLASPDKVTESVPTAIEQESPFAPRKRSLEQLDKTEINRLGRIVLLSLVGFLVTGWFLSRAFVLTLFLIGGLVEAVYQMALQRGMIEPRPPFLRVVRQAAIGAAILITTMYILVRILNFVH